MRTSFAALAVAALLASGGAFAQGASGIGAASSAGTIGNGLDNRAGSTGTATAGSPGIVPTARSSGAAVVQVPATTTTLGAPSSGATVTNEWSVPLGAEHDPNFQRWQRLK